MSEQQISVKEFGAMQAQVAALGKQVESLTSKVDELLALANRSRGGFWVGMWLAGALGGVVATAAKALLMKP
jgi:hypothetical protein